MRILLILILINMLLLTVSAQSSEKLTLLGGLDQSKGDAGKTIKELRQAVSERDDGQSYFDLAAKLIEKNDPHSRYLARKYLQEAIYREPYNMEYRYELAELIRYETPQIAFDVYENITEIDSSQTEAWYQMARIREDDFTEYNNSVRIMSEDITWNLGAFAYGDFEESEKFYHMALESSEDYSDALLRLSTLYEEFGDYDKAITTLERLVESDPGNKDGYLYLGMVYYKNSHIEESYDAYQRAIYLMSYDEREDFTYNSVIDLLLDDIGGRLMTKSEVKKIIAAYWKAYDPLLLTDYNERLLEHYTRVAYANLKFGIPHKDITGWKTDRGETYIRYGEPLERYTIRPEMGDEKPLSKTEVWHYDNMSIAFADKYWSGNYRYAAPDDNAQVPWDSHTFMALDYPEYHSHYLPKYDGPYFEVPYDIIQFRNLDRPADNLTDFYVTYAIDRADSLDELENGYAHNAGLFFLDKDFNTVYKSQKEIVGLNELESIKAAESEAFVNAIGFSAYPDSGHVSFELIRKADKGFASNKGRYRIKQFTGTGLAISDVVLASKITPASEAELKRGDIGLVPNPMHKFGSEDDLYIYYEVYNLAVAGDNLNRFEQKFVIQSGSAEEGGFEIGDIFSPLLSLVGFGGDDKVMLTSEYRTMERNSRVYVQLDMSGYDPGEYRLTTIVTDKISGEEVSTDTYIIWE